ncbi:hypothetical protein MYX77_06945 [Acidobacteriia bacterium AH_259_A11_L15]|nr:hypothetical protein [Acidobacteriia bacterium AH_259_A11_L15]
MSKGRAFLSIVVVAIVNGAALSFIFWPLMDFERLSHNEREYTIWLLEWIGFDLLLTAFLCRREIGSLFGRKKTG